MGFFKRAPEKEFNRKENTMGKIAKSDRFESLHFSDIDPSKVLFYYVMSCDKDNRDLSSKI